MACLVTGGTGFIGSYAVRDLLKAGKEVICLQRSGVTPVFREVVGEGNLNRVKIVQGDVSNIIFLFNLIKDNHVDVIVHAAAILSSGTTPSSETEPYYALHVNGIGMLNLLEASRLLGVRKIVWTSTGQVFGKVGDYYKLPIKDDDGIYMPNAWYSATKVLDEFAAKLYYQKFGVDSIGLRIGLTLGIGKIWGGAGGFTDFITRVATDKPATMASDDADRVRCMGYIDNVTDLIIKACDAPTTKTRTFNAFDYFCSARQLVDSMRKVNPGARITLKEGVPAAEATWAGTPEPALDTTGLQRELGWKPKYSLEEALRRIFNQYRQMEGLPLL